MWHYNTHNTIFINSLILLKEKLVFIGGSLNKEEDRRAPLRLAVTKSFFDAGCRSIGAVTSRPFLAQAREDVKHRRLQQSPGRGQPFPDQTSLKAE